MLNGKSVLITGGTGSFGQKFVEIVFKRYPAIKRLAVLSRDELKQYEMGQRFPKSRYHQIRFFIGDVRDKERLCRAFEDVDIVIHAAALKQVPAAEYNPFEFIKTNVLGAQNVVEACLDTGVKKVVAISTDKAAAPINLYGATKLCSDKLFVAANNMKGKRDIQFAVVRYGNVLGSRGSVIPLFLAQRGKGAMPITDERMTRFNISMQAAVDLVLKAIDIMWGGEIFIPKIPSVKILDIAEAVAPGCPQHIIGMRPGEKLHEEMITETDALNTIEFNDYYVVLPSLKLWDVAAFARNFNGRPCPSGFKYTSATNEHWLTVQQIRDFIRQYIDARFQPLTTASS